MEDVFHLGIKAIIRNEKGEILLLKTNPRELIGYYGKAYWDIPGGRIHKGDSIEKTLKRELLEETGIKKVISYKPFNMVLSNVRIPKGNDDFGLILSAYICDVEKISKVVISNEHTESGWFIPKKAAKLLEFKYPKDFVEKIADIDKY